MAALDAICKTHPISEDREEKIEEKYEEATAAEPSECTQEEKKDSEHTTEENNKEFNAGNESYKILIIDDDDAILDVTEQIFTTHGCTVQKAKDGKKGLEILEKENKTLPDLVILDVNMPNMNGFEVLEKIGEDPVLKGVPVIMLTGRTEDESIMESIGSGALDYITKPFDPTSLIKTTLRILRRTHTKVLVVDDDELICELLEQHFRRIGYSVMKEYNGTDGWKTIKEKKPDIVVLDIMMPGMDGMSVLKHAKSDPETQDIPIIMLTAKSQNDNILKGLEGGAHDYVTKPFDVEEIAARVAGILRHRKKG
jgi:DNA-binding response OmpR family regulator